MPIDIQNLLFRVADTFYGAESVARVIESNFHSIPDDKRNELLLKLADKESAINFVFNKVISYRNEFPTHVRDQLFLKLADKESLAHGLIEPLILDFHQLPDNIRNILFNLANKPNLWIDGYLARAIVSNFDKLPEEVTIKLLTTLFDKHYYTVFRELAYNFEELPENIRILFFSLAENIDGGTLTLFIYDQLDRLGDNVRNKLLLKLAESKEGAGYVADVLYGYIIEKLPLEVKNELQKRLEKHGYNID